MNATQRTVRLESDSRQFVIDPLDGGDLVVGSEMPDNSLLTVEEADGRQRLVVLTGSQWGPFEVTVRRHDEPPDLNADGWEDVIELSVVTTAGLAVDETPNADPVTLMDRGGTLRLRLSARGRDRGRARDDDPDWDLDSDTLTLEFYLLDIWPTPAAPAQVLAGSREAERAAADLQYDDLPEWPPGLAAAVTVTRALTDVAAGHPLSGERGEVTVEREVGGAARQRYVGLSRNPGNIVGMTIGGGPDEKALWWFPEHGLLVPARGHLRTYVVEEHRPRRALSEWTWAAPPPGRLRVAAHECVPVLPGPTIVEVTFQTRQSEDGDDRCLVRISHRDLPVEWLEPMRAYWELHLAITDHWEQLGEPGPRERRDELVAAALGS